MKRHILTLLLVLSLLPLHSLGLAHAAPLGQEGREYVVQEGDTLWLLAEEYLGTGNAYVAIVVATNVKHAQDPTFAEIDETTNAIRRGWKIFIPSAKEAAEIMTAAPLDIGVGLEKYDFSGVEIRTIFWPTPLSQTWAEGSKVFEEKTGAKVVWEFGSEEEVRAKLELDFTSQTGNYTIVMVDNWTLPAEAGYLLPLDDLLAEKVSPWLTTDWPEVTREALTYKSQLYGLPWALGVPQMAYRKDLFEKYGLEVPTTMEELEEACKKLKAGFEADGLTDIYPIAMRGEDNSIESAGWGWAWGGQWLDENNVPTVNEEKWVAGIKFYTDLLRNYGPPDVAVYTPMEVSNAFTEGHVAIVIDSSPVTGRFLDPEVAPKVYDKVAYAIDPKGPERYPCHLWASGWGINAFASDEAKEATWVYIQWITSDKVLHSMVPDLPGVNFYANPDVMGRIAPTNAAVAPAIEAAKHASSTYMPRLPEYPELRDIFGDAVSSIVAGEIEAQEAMNQAAAKMTEVLKKAGRIKE